MNSGRSMTIALDGTPHWAEAHSQPPSTTPNTTNAECASTNTEATGPST